MITMITLCIHVSPRECLVSEIVLIYDTNNKVISVYIFTVKEIISIEARLKLRNSTIVLYPIHVSRYRLVYSFLCSTRTLEAACTLTYLVSITQS